jgi:ABC-2 type transport system ATP-binding protein
MTDMAIETSRLIKKYGDAMALNGLTLNAPEGWIFGLLGHNGAGKTITVSILTTLLAPSSGTARVGGHDIIQNPARVRQTAGQLPASAIITASSSPRKRWSSDLSCPLQLPSSAVCWPASTCSSGW